MTAKLVTIAALLAALLALSLFWKPWQTSLKLKREIASVGAALEARDVTLQEQAARLDRLRDEQNALKKELAALHQKRPVLRTASTSVDAKTGKEEFIRRTLDDPQMKESFRQFEIGRLRQVYSDFFRDREFSPEQSAQFLDLVFSQEERDMEDGTRFLSGDQDPGKSPFTTEETDREMKELLGEDAFAKFEEYDKTTTERLTLTNVREALGRSSAALDDDQADSLLQIMMEERERTPLTAFDPRISSTSRDKFIAVAQGDNAEQFYRAQTDLNQRILSRTGTILSSEQYETLENVLNQYFEVQKISIEMARQVAAGGKGR